MTSKRRALVELTVLGLASVGIIAWMILDDGLQELMNFVAAQADTESRPAFLIAYVALCVISLVLIIPSGSLLLIAAGFVLGIGTATAVYSVLHCLLCWPVYKVAKSALFDSNRYDPQLILERYLSPVLQTIVGDLRKEPVATSLVLRLTPVVPSAAACIAAAALGIGFMPFFLVTVAACWIRPLFYAAAGASLASIVALENPMALVRTTDITPLLILFAATLILLAVKLLLRRLKVNKEQGDGARLP